MADPTLESTDENRCVEGGKTGSAIMVSCSGTICIAFKFCFKGIAMIDMAP